MGDLVLVKDHTAKSFEPKYKEDYRVVQIYGTNALQVSDKRGKLHNVHITDVKRINMTEKVATQLEQIYSKGRKAKSLIPQGLIPDLGWNTDQQGKNRQTLPKEKQPEVAVTQTTPIQVEGPQAVDFDPKQIKINQQINKMTRIHRNAIPLQWTHQTQSKRLTRYKLLQQPVTGCR